MIRAQNHSRKHSNNGGGAIERCPVYSYGFFSGERVKCHPYVGTLTPVINHLRRNVKKLPAHHYSLNIGRRVEALAEIQIRYGFENIRFALAIFADERVNTPTEDNSGPRVIAKLRNVEALYAHCTSRTAPEDGSPALDGATLKIKKPGRDKHPPDFTATLRIQAKWHN
jgi:hypothetical protein